MLPVRLSSALMSCGLFGAVRKFDVHTGLDLYCAEDETVISLHHGKVIDVFQFTGENVGTPWWEDTYAILLRCGELDILYGELHNPRLRKGSYVGAGQPLGAVKRVLREDKGKTPTSMLHLEVWDRGSFVKDIVWRIGEDVPTGLRDPMTVIETLKVDYWVVKRETGYILQDTCGNYLQYFDSAVDSKAHCMFNLTGAYKYISVRSSPEIKLNYFKHTGVLLNKELY